MNDGPRLVPLELTCCVNVSEPLRGARPVLTMFPSTQDELNLWRDLIDTTLASVVDDLVSNGLTAEEIGQKVAGIADSLVSQYQRRKAVVEDLEHAHATPKTKEPELVSAPAVSRLGVE